MSGFEWLIDADQDAWMEVVAGHASGLSGPVMVGLVGGSVLELTHFEAHAHYLYGEHEELGMVVLRPAVVAFVGVPWEKE